MSAMQESTSSPRGIGPPWVTLPAPFVTRTGPTARTAPATTPHDVLQLTITPEVALHDAQHPETFVLEWDAGRSVATTGFSLRLPHAAFARVKPDLVRHLHDPPHGDNPAMRLLIHYLREIAALPNTLPPTLRRCAVEHVCNLLLLALRHGEAAPDAPSRHDLAAVRLGRLQRDILARVEAGLRLNLHAVALRHGISPAYVQKLFARAGTSFSAFVLEQRLRLVHRRLHDRRFATRDISAIAYDAGFNSLSWFNRAFRRRYGVTPSRMRVR